MLAAILHAIRDAIRDALAIVLPVECAGCGAPDRAVCDSCLADFTPAVTPRSLATGGEGSSVPVFAALRYEGSVRRAVLAFKQLQRTDVAPALAVPLVAAIDAAAAWAGAVGSPRGLVIGDGPVWVVPVPTSRAGWRSRGYDPVRMLCARGGIAVTPVLASAAARSVQKGLSVDERASNRRGSMRARLPCDGALVIVVDDVITTGSTLREAIRALESAGARVIAAATLASTPRLFAPAATHRQLGGDNDR